LFYTRDFVLPTTIPLEILDWAKMLNFNPIATHVGTHSKLSAHGGSALYDSSLYRSFAGALQYLILTQPDISYTVQQVCLFMHDPRDIHLELVKIIPQGQWASDSQGFISAS
jgi:hypothetical protein